MTIKKNSKTIVLTLLNGKKKRFYKNDILRILKKSHLFEEKIDLILTMLSGRIYLIKEDENTNEFLGVLDE